MARRSPPRELSCPRAAKPRPAREITLLEVHRAVVGAKHEVIDLHAHPNPRCPVGRNIAAALEAPFEEARRAVERTLARRTVASVSAPIRAAVRRKRARGTRGALAGGGGGRYRPAAARKRARASAVRGLRRRPSKPRSRAALRASTSAVTA